MDATAEGAYDIVVHQVGVLHGLVKAVGQRCSMQIRMAICTQMVTNNYTGRGVCLRSP